MVLSFFASFAPSREICFRCSPCTRNSSSSQRISGFMDSNVENPQIASLGLEGHVLSWPDRNGLKAGLRTRASSSAYSFASPRLRVCFDPVRAPPAGRIIALSPLRLNLWNPYPCSTDHTGRRGRPAAAAQLRSAAPSGNRLRAGTHRRQSKPERPPPKARGDASRICGRRERDRG